MPTPTPKETTCTGSTRCRHFDKLARNIMQMKSSETYTDVTLVINDVSLPCHKVILSGACTYFATMFQSGMKEAKADEIQLKFCEADTMQVLLDYFYSGLIAITKNNAQALIEAANLLDLGEVKSDCEAFMASQTNSTNCIGFLRFAKARNLRKLLLIAERYLLDHFEDVVVKSEEFMELSEEELVDLISDDRLTTQDEDLVFCSVQKWVEAPNTQRREIFPRIAKHIRFTFCSKDFLSQLMYGEALMKNPECCELLNYATYSAFVPQKQESNHYSGYLPRLSYASKFPQPELSCITQSSAGVLVKTYQEESKQWSNTVTLYSKSHDATQFFGRLKTGMVCIVNKTCRDFFDFGSYTCYTAPQLSVKGFQSFLLHKTWLMVFGSGEELNSVVTIDLTGVSCKKWSRLAPMLKAPYQSLAVSFGQYIYVFDGGVGHNCCGVTQVYNPKLKHWKMVSQMPSECSGGAAVVLNEKIYVFGGKIKTAMCYDPMQDKWSLLAPPTGTHDPASAVVWKGKILLNGSECVEEYDPQQDCWVQRPELVLQDVVHMLTSMTGFGKDSP